MTALDPFQKGDTFDPATVRWVWSLADVRRVIDGIERAAEIVVDLETTGLDEHATGKDKGWPVAARIVLASFTLPLAADPDNPKPPTYVVPLSHPEGALRGHWRAVVKRLVETMRDSGLPITNQNLKFDLRWLFAAVSGGIDLTSQFAWDTQISSHLLDENASTRLKERGPDTFGVRRWDDHDLSTPAAAERVPLIDLGLYAARDTYWTWRLAVAHRTLMGVGREGEHVDEPEGPEEVEQRRLGTLAVWCAMPTSATLTAIEQRGIGLDVEWMREERRRLAHESSQHLAALVNRYPLDTDRDPSFAPTSLWFAEWADAAVEAGDLRVASLTPGGKPQWSKAVLIRQRREGSEVAGHLLDYRQATKRIEFLDSWLSCVTPEGRVHTTYHAGRVVTGRLSSSGPNMQQVTGALKPAFVPSPGYLIADLDYSQIELRVAAFVSRCEPMLQAYRDGLDLHSLLASSVVDKPVEEVTPEERQGGKAGNFGFLYGMEALGFQTYAEVTYGVSLTEEQAVDVRHAFFQQWEGMSAWHERAVRRARQTGQVVSPIGRVRRLPDIFDGNPSVSSHAERQAINSPVQGFASDLMQMAAASIEGNLPGHEPVPGVRLIGTVHDSIVAEVPEDDWKRATGRMMRRMMDLDGVLARMGCVLDVPLAVEASCGTRWGLSDVGVIK